MIINIKSKPAIVGGRPLRQKFLKFHQAEMGKADAVLVASIFHYGEYTVKQVKECLKKKGFL